MASLSPNPQTSSTPDSGHASSTVPIVRFGLFELDIRARELRKRGVKVRLPDQPFQILQLLLERPGDVVTRDELRQRLWSADTFVDFDLSLNSAVRKLRDALGDSADHSTFIETLPRRGYRFIASVERPPAGSGVEPPIESAPSWVRSRAPLLWGVAVLVVVTCAALLIQRGGWAGFGVAAVPHVRSIAVLPLQNLTGDPAREYVVDGMTDALITELMQLGSVPVISRTSSMQYKGTSKRLPDIARELNVDGIVAGAASLSGSQVRVTAQLVHAATDRHVWAKGYERDAKDVMALQAEIARDIATVIYSGEAPRRSPPAARTQVVDPEAYDLFLKGLAATGRLTYEAHRTAASYFEEAIAKQPDFARAYGNLAQVRLQLLYVGPMSPDEVLPPAEKAARQAVALDATLVEPHRVLAMTRRVYGDHAGADAETHRALELTPSAGESLGFQAALLMRIGRFEDAVAAAERARQADPLSVNRT